MEIMSRIEEIEQAIQQLSPDEFAQLTRWIQELDNERLRIISARCATRRETSDYEDHIQS